MEFGTSKKKILILSASSPNSNSGIVGLDLVNALSDFDCHLVTNSYSSSKQRGIIFLKSTFDYYLDKIKNKIKRIKRISIEESDPSYHMLSVDERKFPIKARKILKMYNDTPDYIISIFPHKFISPKDLFLLQEITGAPIFIYLMDMSPMTGGCHYAWNCNGYKMECGECPGIYSMNRFDETYQNFIFKKKFYQMTNLKVVAASFESYLQLEYSAIFKGKQKYKLHLPINEEIFHPIEYDIACKSLFLNASRKYIFFGAAFLDQKRKGIEYLVEALNYLNNSFTSEESKNIELLVAGHCNDELLSQLPFKVNVLGHLDYENLALAFGASTVFVCPSIEDSGPMMINQAMMCGRPVVSFDIGVARDFIEDGTTGFIVEKKQSKQMANRLRLMLTISKEEYIEISNNCLIKARLLSSFVNFNLNFKKILSDE